MLVNLFVVVIIGCCETQGIKPTVIDQPDNTSTCLGGTAVFTSVLDIQNFDISTNDVSWWRIRRDHNNNESPPLKVTQNLQRFNTSRSISGHRLTSNLMITNVKLIDVGPYWFGLKNSDDELSYVGYLSIEPNAPINIRFPTESITDVSFVVQWNAVISQSFISYVLNWTDGINPTVMVIVNETSYNVTGLTPNTTYTVTVAAASKCGTGPYSTNQEVKTKSVKVNADATTTTIISTTAAIDSMTTSIATVNVTNPAITNPADMNYDSGGSSTGAIVGGVLGGIIAVIIIVIIIIILYKRFFDKSKDTESSKSNFFTAVLSGRSPKANNDLSVYNSLSYNETCKVETKTEVTHQTTDTGDKYAVPSKVVGRDKHNDPPLIYAYAEVDTQRKIVGMSTPNQTAADDVPYVMSSKESAENDDVTDNDVNQKKHQKINYAKLQPLPTPVEVRTVNNEASVQYLKLVT